MSSTVPTPSDRRGPADPAWEGEGPPPHPALVRRANLIGRLSLWFITGFLLALPAAMATGVAWWLSPAAGRDWLAAVHQAFAAAALTGGAGLFIVLFVLQRWLIDRRDYRARGVHLGRVHVALTAYNDEACIAQAVEEFKACPQVHRVIVVDNNSRDRTRELARAAGADAVVTETTPGYGACCMRALAEAAAGLGPGDAIILCEGDLTFSADDVRKMLAYLENCDLVLGTRATQELRESRTQMDWLINPANQIVAKLIQVRFWGVRLTDCGCTYRAMRVGAYERLRGRLWVTGNHFSPHMFIEALKLRMRVIEIPVVFRKRGGFSKGVGSNKLKAARVALAMLRLLYAA